MSESQENKDRARDDAGPAAADDTLAGETTRIPDAQPTKEHPLLEAESTAARPADQEDAPHLHDVTLTLGGYLRGRADRIKHFSNEHRAAFVALVLFAVVVIVFLALAFARTSSVPSTKVISDDALERVGAPSYSSGTFGPDAILVARDVEVRSSKRTAAAIASNDAQFGASGYASANVLVTFSSDAVRAEKTATLGYAHVDGAWVAIGGETDAKVAWHATSGVDQQKVVDNLGVVLTRAESSLDSDEGDDSATHEMSLASIYTTSDVKITGESFDEDAQTDTLQISCVKASSYESYTCQLNVTFAFRPASGQWEIDQTTVNQSAKTRTFDPLEGTWTGTFQSQETDGTKCLAARDAGLTVTIDANSVTASGAQLTGTISGLAHYHDHPSEDAQSCEGDSAFEDVPFTATLVGGYNEATGSDLAFVATLPEDVGGTVTVTLGFGSSDDPDRVVAVVQTTYPHTGSFLFIPYDETLVYTDLFVMKQAD